MDFQEVALADLIEVIFKEYLRYPYTIVGDFKERRVNLVYHGEISEAELFRLLEAVLTFHGAYLKFSNGIYAISDDPKKPPSQAAPGPLGYTTGVFKLRYLDAKDFILVARQFLSEPTLALVIDSANTVIANAPRPEIEAVQSLQDNVDLPFFQGKQVLLYTPRYLSAEALKTLLEKYETLLGASASRKLFQVEVIPHRDRLIVVAYDRDARQVVEGFLLRTDLPDANRQQAFQYPLTSQNAADIAATIKQLGDVIFQGLKTIEVVPDKASNSLFIVATPEQFAELSKLLRRMDYRPAAAHIDLTVLEVVLNDRLRYGVEWYLDSRIGDTILDANLDLSNPFLNDTGSGLDIGVISLTSNKFLALQMLANETDFTILSNPQVIVRNGATASINIGQEIAILRSTTQTDTAGAVTQTQFDRRDVSIVMEVTPDIRADGSILLKLKLKDERDAGVDNNGQPIFNKREVVTDLVTHDGETLFLGGILQKSTNNNVSKVPLLGDVPYMGKLFSNQDKASAVTELVLFMTPRVILDDVGAQLVNRAVFSISQGLPEPAPPAPAAAVPPLPPAPPLPKPRPSVPSRGP
jgi:general secretion pathway protein D